MFYKTLFYGLIAVVLVALLGKINSNTSLYTAESNAVEFIFPVWDWGNPWFYFNVDSNGYTTKKPDDLAVRFAQEKYDEQKTKADLVCHEKNENSKECEEERNKEYDLEDILEIAKDELQKQIDERGLKDEDNENGVVLSKEYKKDEFDF